MIHKLKITKLINIPLLGSQESRRRGRRSYTLYTRSKNCINMIQQTKVVVVNNKYIRNLI